MTIVAALSWRVLPLYADKGLYEYLALSYGLRRMLEKFIIESYYLDSRTSDVALPLHDGQPREHLAPSYM